ncbi:MAG: SH3 domain-containing protein [Clostridia bacterium]|nr:SH3 domain-containing protein [Clostridia bacterium]
MKRLFILLLAAVLLPVLSASAAGTVSLSADTLPAGQVLDITVNAGGSAVSCLYSVTMDGNKVYTQKKATDHFSASYLPEKAGQYELSVTVTYNDKTKETLSAPFTVLPADGDDAIPSVYSQKDGTWDKKPYRKSTLEKAGCAIFTLSHALHRMGITGEDTMPAELAVTYKYCLIQGGTRNNMLTRNAAEKYNFLTEEELIKDQTRIADELRRGSMFTFSIVIGHIALVDGISEDGSMVHIVDSAPTATAERIKKASMYTMDESGQFIPFSAPEELPEAHWFFETSGCGGLEYWLELSYVAKRGVRLIQPSPFTLTGSGSDHPVVVTVFGTSVCTISDSGQESTVPAKDLIWNIGADDGARIAAVVTKKTYTLIKDSAGKKAGKAEPGTILPVIGVDGDTVTILDGSFVGNVSKKDVELIEVSDKDPLTARIALNGNTSGRAKIRARLTPSAKGKTIAQWPTGTAIAVIEEKGDWCRVEAKGLCLWVEKKNVLYDEEQYRQSVSE